MKTNLTLTLAGRPVGMRGLMYMCCLPSLYQGVKYIFKKIYPKNFQIFPNFKNTYFAPDLCGYCPVMKAALEGEQVGWT